MVNLGNFNTKESGTMDTRVALPRGDYPVSIVSSKRVDKQDGSGKWNIHLTAKVLDGPKQGQQALIICNYGYPGVTGDIAKRQLGSICEAVGRHEISDTSELHNVPFFLRTMPQKDNPEYNEHKAYYSIDAYKRLSPEQRWVVQQSTPVQHKPAAGDTAYSEKLKDFPAPQFDKESAPWS